jgi:hypothetical protein
MTMNKIRLLLTGCIIAAVGIASVAPAFSQPSSIVVCQKKKKKNKIKLRADSCRANEDLVINLTQTMTGDETTAGRVTAIERYLGLVCEGDSSRTVMAGLNEETGCAEYDGDETGCASAFVSLGLGKGAASCFFDPDDECAGCGATQEGSGYCTNTCSSD